MDERYLGMISGTSTDGVDAALVSFSESGCRIVAASTTPYPAALHRRISSLIDAATISLRELGSLDSALGEFFAACALSLLENAGVAPSTVTAIGHHGQTVYHKPTRPEPFTMQIGDPNVVAARTGICTVGDFRRLDVAHEGQGAPLVPAFHDWLFRDESEERVVLNIGGIANVTILKPDKATLGFDTGPGNALLDAWINARLGRPFDESGKWASGGKVCRLLLAEFMAEPYFHLGPPKSTGRELFNLGWVSDRLSSAAPDVAARDVQATLAELTAQTIAASISTAAPDCQRIIVCGGGAFNRDLLARLARLCGNIVETSSQHGIGEDWVEAAAFAWLARARLQGRASNMPSVTGAHQRASLGGIYSGAMAPHRDHDSSERSRRSNNDTNDAAILQS